MKLLKNRGDQPPASSEISQFLIAIALILGALVRFAPVIISHFPVNDGGMFYVMVMELRANSYMLPSITQYNLASIPFVYPPFGFYVTALLSDLFRLPELTVVRWLPALVSSLSLLAFYGLAREFIHARTQAALATLFYALMPASFGWPIMGGGITRSFGLLFIFLTITYTNRLYNRSNSTTIRPSRSLLAVLTALYGALAVLSHPETGLQAAAACLLLWFFHGKSWSNLAWSMLVALGVIVFTAPWWGTVLSSHGLTPFLSALQTSNDGTFSAWVSLLALNLSEGIFFNFVVALGLLGVLATLSQRDYLLPLWVILPFVVDPRSARGLAFLPLSMLAAMGFEQVLAPALLSLRKKPIQMYADRFVFLTLIFISLYLFFSAGIYGLGLANSSLSSADRETILWVDEHIPPGSDFLLLTGEKYSMKDPFQEWFPALTRQHSQTTLQGLEWTLGEQFFPYYAELVALQRCAEISCIERWSARTGLDHRYLLIKTEPQITSPELKASLALLLESAHDSRAYQVVYEAENAFIFERNK